MHFPRMCRELLMLPASFRRSPNVLVLLHLSEPARSHSENLQKEVHSCVRDSEGAGQDFCPGPTLRDT